MTVQHAASVEPQVEWIARYLSQVECRYCGTAVYPGDESDETRCPLGELGRVDDRGCSLAR